MDKSPLVYVIILSYNGASYVLRLLNSIYQSSYRNFVVLLVDNNSKDNTIITVKKRFPECEVIVNKSNLGFAAGCNVGIKKSMEDDAEFILLLNQDCIIQKNTILNLLSSAKNNSLAGVIGPKTWFYQSSKKSKERISYAGSWRFLLPLLQRVPGVGKIDNGKYDRNVPTDYVWGHGMFLKVSALRKVGLLDPDFFMYYEDLDICRRMKKAGYQVWYEPSAVMWHDIPDALRGSSSEGWRWEYRCRSVHIFHRKYYGVVFARILDVLSLLSEIIRLLLSGYFLAARDFAYSWIKTLRTRKNAGLKNRDC